MSTWTGLGIFVGAPLLGAVLALLLGQSRPWQLILGAVLGEAVGWMVGRAWSEYAATRALRSGGMIMRATGLDWRNHLLTAALLLGVAVLVGALVALARRLLSPGH